MIQNGLRRRYTEYKKETFIKYKKISIKKHFVFIEFWIAHFASVYRN